MTKVMQGVRILEVAEQTFVPAASALMSDWGADVIKIEHVERGDAMRGLASTGTALIPTDVHVLFEHSNRGKRSLGLDLTTPEGLDILYQLAAEADIFLTNKLARVRTKLKIDVDDIRKQNPKIIYVRGTGQGDRGPDRDRGSYDALAFWDRSGAAAAVMRPEDDHVPNPPGPGFGDSIGAMTIAGGMMGALYHREKTGEGSVVDVSLFSSAMWAVGQSMAISVLTGGPVASPPKDSPGRNPLVSNYQTKDGRWLCFCCLQAGQYWGPMCEVIERPDLITDPRFVDHASLMANSVDAQQILTDVFAQRTLAEWRTQLADFSGQWAVAQNSYEAATDPQALANGYVQDCETSEGKKFQLAAAPVQFDEEAASPKRAPEFNEHGDDILTELGLDMEKIIDLKVRGVIA